MGKLNDWIKKVAEAEAPDLHLQVGRPPMVRLKNGALQAILNEPGLTESVMNGLIAQLLNEKQRAVFETKKEQDFSWEPEAGLRLRVNAYWERLGPALSMRLIPAGVPDMEKLGLPASVQALTALPRGLIIVTGPAGMGKSTTLASMIEAINQNRAAHIITIEDPIEFIHESKKSLVSQREVSRHTESFAQAIRSALRQDPDVVMVGEMRDLETIAAALTLAETGHLVLSSLHTSDAAQTVDRIIDVFPAYQQQQVRAQLADSLKGVVAQTLLPGTDGTSRVAAREVLIVTDAVRNCIMQGQTHQLYSLLQLGGKEGMVSMDQSLATLCRAGQITQEQAIAKSSDPDTLTRFLSES